MRRLILGLCRVSAAVATSAIAPLAAPVAIGVAAIAFAADAPEPFRWHFDPTPRSIFETRRAGLA
jgi:hypothetical protein